ncbi:MAG: T9SS type A sorting domain-containing protein [Flavitalea sp.]
MRILYLLCFLLIVSLKASSQNSNVPGRENSARIIRFYPNPAVSQINFDFIKGYDKNYTFQIYSFLGKKVLDLSNVSPKTTVNLTDYFRGVYIFQLRDKNGKIVESGKFQVSK